MSRDGNGLPRPLAALRGLAAVAAAALLVGCASAAPGDLTVADLCTEIADRGLFNPETLACFPDLEERLRVPLCKVQFRSHGGLARAGFGVGTTVYGQTVGKHPDALWLDGDAVLRWKQEHCGDVPDTETVLPPDLAAAFGEIWESLPDSLAGPWRDCAGTMVSPEYEDTLKAKLFQPVRENGLWCRLVGSHDLDGTDGLVQFEASYSTGELFDYAARMRRDLVVEGAECGGEAWRRGTRLPAFQRRVLTCRRQGTAAVTVRMRLAGLECALHLPELEEPPWREQCRGRAAPSAGDVD